MCRRPMGSMCVRTAAGSLRLAMRWEDISAGRTPRRPGDWRNSRRSMKRCREQGDSRPLREGIRIRCIDRLLQELGCIEGMSFEGGGERKLITTVVLQIRAWRVWTVVETSLFIPQCLNVEIES